jgi:hypothetical protein
LFKAPGDLIHFLRGEYLAGSCDAFLAGALVDRFERPIQSRVIYPAHLGLICKTLLPRRRINHYFDLETAIRGQWESQNRLTEILVRVSDLPAFCERTNTILPPPLLSGRLRRWLAARGGKHPVPPACRSMAAMGQFD